MRKTALCVVALGCAFGVAAAQAAIVRGGGASRNDGGGGEVRVFLTATLASYSQELTASQQLWLINPDFLPVPVNLGNPDEPCAVTETMFCTYSVGAGESRLLHVTAAFNHLQLALFPLTPFQRQPDLTITWTVFGSGGVTLGEFVFANQDAGAEDWEFDLNLNGIAHGEHTLQVEFAFSFPEDKFDIYENLGLPSGDIRNSGLLPEELPYLIRNGTKLYIDEHSVPVEVDEVAPQVSVTGVTDGATYTLGSVPTAGCETTDADSGVHTPATLEITGGTSGGVGNFSATCSGALDNAGNEGPSVSVHYSVEHAFQGFFSPVDNVPVRNRLKAGQAVPLKFSLGGNFGLDILASGSPASAAMTCSGGLSDAIEETATPGSSTLSYDSVTGYYQYVWKTPKSYAGTCRALLLKLKDGTTHTAYFEFK